MATEEEKPDGESGTARNAVDDLLASVAKIQWQPRFDEGEKANSPVIDAAFPKSTALRAKREKELKEQWEQALRDHVYDVWHWNRAKDDAFKARRQQPSWDDYIKFDRIEELTKESGRVPKAAFAFAVEEGMLGLMQKLVELGAKPTADNLITAIEGKYHFIVRHVLEMGAKPDQKVIYYIAERLDVKGEPVDELIDRAVREMADACLHVLLATGTPPREDTMHYALTESISSIYLKELAAARKPSQEMVDFAVLNGRFGARDLMATGVFPSRETLDFIGGKVDETEYIEKLRYGMPGADAWKEKFIADGGDPAQAASALQDLIMKRNSHMTAEHSILETIGDTRAVPVYVLDYVAERLGAQPGEPLDELLDKSVHQDEGAIVHLLLGAGAVPREDTMYFVLADDDKELSSLVKGTKSIKHVLIEACMPTPGMLDYLVREKQYRYDIEELIKAGAEPALETVGFVDERLSEADNLLSKVYSNLPFDFSSEEYQKARREAKEEERRVGNEKMKWQTIKRILEEGLNGKTPLPLQRQNPLDEAFNDAALDKLQQPPQAPSLSAIVNEALRKPQPQQPPSPVQDIKRRGAALLKGLRRRFLEP